MSELKVDLSKYENQLSKKHQMIRFVWNIVWPLCTWFLPRSIGSGWKRFLLRLFGSKIHPTAVVYSSAKVYYPANLVMEEYACLASDVDCYNVDVIRIGAHSTISQGVYLCTASHDITDLKNSLITKPIMIGNQVWVGAEAFVGLGVNIGEGAVIGARAAVFKNVAPWTVVGGNPAKEIKKRVLRYN